MSYTPIGTDAPAGCVSWRNTRAETGLGELTPYAARQSLAFVVSGLQWEGGISSVCDAEASEEGTFVQGLEAIPSQVQGLGLVRSSVPHKCVM